MLRAGIVVCSRLDSERLPNKVMRKINGIPVLVHLLRRLLTSGFPVVVAVPQAQYDNYLVVLNEHELDDKVLLHGSVHANDPLARMAEVQRHYRFSHVIRVTHDKVFVNIEKMLEAWNIIKSTWVTDVNTWEYLYSSSLQAGTGFEIIRQDVLQKAAAKFTNVEHISYAIRLVSGMIFNFDTGIAPNGANLLIDFPEDLKMMEVIHSQLGNEATTGQVFDYLAKNPELKKINSNPIATVYTCAYNAAKYLDQAVASVQRQSVFSEIEYIIIDDHSSDATCEMIAKFALQHPNVKWFRNERNIGLASSSNFALKQAKGKYLIRIDADDYFSNEFSLARMINEAQKIKCEILYPDNFFGSMENIQKGNECHHVGGALFDRNALNFVKFTDGLRNYEGLDLFVRAKNSLKISYLKEPTFFYRQHNSSMSKTNLAEREKTKQQILDAANVENL